ncbi:Pet127-domain-containing protein [Xylaria arbuscula]|nr:Pet127-domain-containing protein [Xylaria arbuscula]
MDYLRRCFAQRKSSAKAHDDVNTGHSTTPNVPSYSPAASSEDFKTLTDLRQKCEENTLSTAEARALLDASGKVNAPLTPREIEELHRILSPPPPNAKPGTSSLAPVPERSPRTPTNHMLPDPQAQSDLFCLPAEVRTQIWQYAVGGRKIYLAVKGAKLVQQENLECPYWRHVPGLLSVPLICRKSYLESINLLYSDNTFGFGIGSVGSSKDFFTKADTLLLPQCIAAMTSLEVGFHLSGGYSQYYDSHPQAWDISLHIVAPEPLSSWNCVFRALAQMKQLRSLVVVVWASGDRRHEFRARESELMEIPSGMTGLRKFEVWLPWKEEKEGVLSQHADKKPKPYVVKRNFDDRPRFGLGRRGLCRFTSPHLCASCLATSQPASILSRRRIAASYHHVRPLSTTLTGRQAAAPDTTHDASTPAVDITPSPSKPRSPQKKKKKKKPSNEHREDTALPETDTDRQLKVLEGALSALKNVLSTRGVDVSQNSPHSPKSAVKAKSRSKAEKTGDTAPKASTSPDTPSQDATTTEAESQSSIPAAATKARQPRNAVKPPGTGSKAKKERKPAKPEPRRKRKAGNRPPPKSSMNHMSLRRALSTPGDLGEDQGIPPDEGIAHLLKPANLGVPFGTKSPSTKKTPKPHKIPDKVHPHDLSLFPIATAQPPVPSLSYDLERALFNPGVYQLQDTRSRVYNFDPYLSEIMPIAEFDFNALKQYVTSSKDTTLISIAKEHQKKYTGSTSSMTSMLAHFHYLLSAWRNINVSMLSRSIVPESVQFTRIMRAPAATFLHWKDGTYAIDADKEFDTANILSMLGKSMEKLLTLSKDEYERYRRGNSDQITEEERNAEEAFHYTGFQDFMMRSQLDAYDPRLPGTGMFDLKTRAVISIRMDAQGYEKGLGYEIQKRFGEWVSFEREYYDMIRSAFLKYSLQVRMGRMDGIFVAFHNTQRIFGFQYIPLEEMDLTLHGTDNRQLGDHEFKISLKLLNELLNRATQKWPEQSLRLHFETRETKGAPFMYFFAKPASSSEIEAVQNAGKASVDAFEKKILGLTDIATMEVEHQIEVSDKSEDNADHVDPSPAQEMDGFAAWQEARQMVEEAIGDDEHGVGLVREAIGDALEQSGILRAKSLAESREYVDALLGALMGRAPSTEGDVTATDPNEEEAVDEDELEEKVSGRKQELDESCSPIQLENWPIFLGGSPYLGHPKREVHDTQPHDSDKTSIKELTHETLDTTTLAGSPASNAKEEEEEEEDEDEEEEEDEEDEEDEETSEAELESGTGAKEFRDDVGSSLKSLIMRMARKIDEQPVSSTSPNGPQDDAAKLKEFERILGQLISQSRTDQFERDSEEDVLAQDSTSELATDGSNAFTTDAQREDTPQPTVAQQTQNEKETPKTELLALTLTIKNKVNGKYVDRPRKLDKDDKWTVEYEIEEIEQSRAAVIYGSLKERRRKTLYATGDRSSEWYRMFGGNLTKWTEQGREFREQETERSKGQPVYTVGNKGPLEWHDVFGRQPKNSQASNEGDEKGVSKQTKDE